MVKDNRLLLLECLDAIKFRGLPRGEMSVRIYDLEDASRMTPLDYCP